jgi:hypothetical protein
MSCGGGHLGFPIGTKNRNLAKDIPMIIHLQFGFSQFIISSPGPKVQVNYCHHLASVVCKLFTFQASSSKPLGQLEPNMLIYVLRWRPSWISDRHKKNRNLVKDIPMIIPLQFGFSQFISFREEDLWNFSQSEHIIVHLDQRSMWTIAITWRPSSVVCRL